MGSSFIFCFFQVHILPLVCFVTQDALFLAYGHDHWCWRNRFLRMVAIGCILFFRHIHGFCFFCLILSFTNGGVSTLPQKCLFFCQEQPAVPTLRAAVSGLIPPDASLWAGYRCFFFLRSWFWPLFLSLTNGGVTTLPQVCLLFFRRHPALSAG